MGKSLGFLRPTCHECGWRKGGHGSWNGGACKCGHTEPPITVHSALGPHGFLVEEGVPGTRLVPLDPKKEGA